MKFVVASSKRKPSLLEDFFRFLLDNKYHSKFNYCARSDKRTEIFFSYLTLEMRKLFSQNICTLEVN